MSDFKSKVLGGAFTFSDSKGETLDLPAAVTTWTTGGDLASMDWTISDFINGREPFTSISPGPSVPYLASMVCPRCGIDAESTADFQLGRPVPFRCSGCEFEWTLTVGFEGLEE